MVGPRPAVEPLDFDRYNDASLPLDVEHFVTDLESKVQDLKPGNAAEIIWADTSKSKTPFVLLYLHGFSSSHEEGNPMHRRFADSLGMNVYLSRLYGHGRASEDSFIDFDPSDYYASAEEALAVAKTLGDSIVVMSCSTGGTLSILLASEHPEIHSFIMFSPNIDLADPASGLTQGPWGKELLSIAMGGDHNVQNYGVEQAKYWNEKYHLNGIISLKYMLDNYMTTDYFAKVDQPLYMGYFYKDEEHQDNVVSVARMLDFYNECSTPERLKAKEGLSKCKRACIYL